MSEKSRTLADLSIGQSGYVRIVNGDGCRRRRIIDMGITPGTEIKIIKAAPMGDPIEIAMRGYSLSLRREDAQRIELLTDGEAKELREKAVLSARNLELKAKGSLTHSADEDAPYHRRAAMITEIMLKGRCKPGSCSGCREEGVCPICEKNGTQEGHDGKEKVRLALVGNPNSGKTTLFNAMTGSREYVGNWPGVTVEKKEGRLRKHEDVVIMDLPGIYSLSPYTLEEVVARNYLIDQRPDAILNIIDGTNLERNLYLTTQLTELGIPVVVAINMMDVVRKNGDKIDTAQLSEKLGCRIVEISALKGDGVMEAAEAAIKAAHGAKTVPMHTFSGPVEHAIAHIEEAAVHNMPLEQQRWYAIKIFERDDKVLEKLDISKDVLDHIDSDIKAAEKELDDDAESIITNERYVYIAEIIKCCYKKKNQGRLSASDKIDRVVTNRWLGLPIFAAVMFLVYYLAMVTVGASATDWANDGLFGDGWHLFGIGSAA